MGLAGRKHKEKGDEEEQENKERRTSGASHAATKEATRHSLFFIFQSQSMPLLFTA